MKVGDITKQVISQHKKKKWQSQVVYKTFLGNHNGKPRYQSQTRHETGTKQARNI